MIHSANAPPRFGKNHALWVGSSKPFSGVSGSGVAFKHSFVASYSQLGGAYSCPGDVGVQGSQACRSYVSGKGPFLTADYEVFVISAVKE